MILRIVRMEFEESTIDAFESLFQKFEKQIRHQPGCHGLELHGDPDHPFVRYTHSKWESTEHLNAYRYSELFDVVWPQTKKLFAGRPKAYSLSLIRKVE